MEEGLIKKDLTIENPAKENLMKEDLTKEDLRKKDFTEWNKTLYYSYYKVADKLRDYLKKAQLIND